MFQLLLLRLVAVVLLQLPLLFRLVAMVLAVELMLEAVLLILLGVPSVLKSSATAARLVKASFHMNNLLHCSLHLVRLTRRSRKQSPTASVRSEWELVLAQTVPVRP